MATDDQQAARGAFLRRSLGRLARATGVALWVMVIAFGLIRIAPGDPVIALLGAEAPPAAIEKMRRDLRLDVDPATQFVEYTWGMLHGRLGTSIETRRDVADIIAESLPVTLGIIAVTLVLALAMAVPLALLIATRRSPIVPYVFRATTSVMLAIPTFFTALIGLILFGLHWRIAPIIGYEPGFPGNLRFLWLPALVICTHLVPVLSRVLHASLVQTRGEEFVETGIIRGVSRLRFAWFYLLKPSLAPSIVLLSYMVGVMIGSTVIIETIFSLPGIGRSLVGAVINRDYPLVQGIVLVFGLFVVAVSLAGDLLANWLDPRVGAA